MFTLLYVGLVTLRYGLAMAEEETGGAMAEPPENGGYMIAAYVVAPVILVGYAVMLVRRARRAIERVTAEDERVTLSAAKGTMPAWSRFAALWLTPSA